jgi:SAM-dependent MidA family methyltransferase
MTQPRRDEAIDFPLPEPAALEHSRRLIARIRSGIDAAGGRIAFRRFMELALYAPGLGYYSAGSVKFGRDGDFTTAPELSPLFSACVARQCGEILGRCGGVILELGAGSGALALGILGFLRDSDRLPDEYLILEPSADLRQRQQELLSARLPQCRGRIRWLDALPERPLRGVILANEVLDAVPVHRVRLRGGAIEELGVGWDGRAFEWRAAIAEPGLVARALGLLAAAAALPPEYTTEINPDLVPWFAAIAGALERGAVLLFDYGYPRREYYHPDRIEGTLICHYRHRAHPDPFLYPGLQDISAAVDFTGVAEAAAAAGLSVAGFTTQAHFLIGCGLHDLPQLDPAAAGRERLEFARQAKLLTLPGEMGESIKAMAILRGIDGPLMGFSGADHRRRL